MSKIEARDANSVSTDQINCSHCSRNLAPSPHLVSLAFNV